MDQGTPEWFAARLGMITASRIKDVVARTKTGWGAGRKNYCTELALERITGQSKDSYTNAAMQWGVDNEPLARLAYSAQTGLEVEEVGFIQHPTIARSGASPDGLVDLLGCLEIKCPNTATHIEWAIAGVVPAEHVLQMQWQMECTGRKWCDFVSFDPRMPAGQQLFIRRLHRDDDQIKSLAAEVEKFDAEVEGVILSLPKVTWF
jgi:putative phage-type endonuclease